MFTVSVAFDSVWPNANVTEGMKAALMAEVARRAPELSLTIEEGLKGQFIASGGVDFTGRMYDSLGTEILDTTMAESEDTEEIDVLDWGYFPDKASGANTQNAQVQALSLYYEPVEYGYGGQRMPPLSRIYYWMKSLGIKGNPLRIGEKIMAGRPGLHVLEAFGYSGEYQTILDTFAENLAADSLDHFVREITFQQGGQIRTAKLGYYAPGKFGFVK